jgi:hypothetical protein
MSNKNRSQRSPVQNGASDAKRQRSASPDKTDTKARAEAIKIAKETYRKARSSKSEQQSVSDGG